MEENDPIVEEKPYVAPKRTRPAPQRRRTGDTGASAIMQGMPWWGKSIWVLGPVTFFCVALFAVHVGWAPSPMLSAQTDMLKALSMLTAAIGNHDSRLASIEERNQKGHEEVTVNVIRNNATILSLSRDLNTGLRKICRNTAKDAKANEGCDAIQ